MQKEFVFEKFKFDSVFFYFLFIYLFLYFFFFFEISDDGLDESAGAWNNLLGRKGESVILTCSNKLSPGNFWGTCRILHLLSIPGNSCTPTTTIVQTSVFLLNILYVIRDSRQMRYRSHLHRNDNLTTPFSS